MAPSALATLGLTVFMGTHELQSVNSVCDRILLALAVPLQLLAEWTSLATLLVFVLVNLSLLRLRWRERRGFRADHLRVPLWVPALGFLTSIGMMATSFLPA